MSVPTEHSKKAATDDLLRIKQPSQCTVIQKLWDELVCSLQPYSELIQDIEHSIHRAHHVARILDNFAATTLAKYIPALTHFVDACHCLHISLNSLTAVQMADGLIAVRLARSSDGIYMNSATIIKALRWSVKQLGVDCFQCSFDGLISKFLADKIPRDVKESLPLPLYCFLHWERKILVSSTDPLLTVILGSFLLQAWTGLRWADLQRVSPINLIFDFDNLRGIAWRTKTTTKGQAFGCIASGFLSRGTHNWLLVYLRALDKLYSQHGDPSMDFVVPRITGEWRQLHLVLPLEPMRYADALYYLRTVILTPWRQHSYEFDIQNYTIHGLKATLLSWCSQLQSITEEMRRQQGHHKPVNASVRLYSRDDVHPQLALQSILVREVLGGFRPCTPLHRGGQAPAVEPQMTVEQFQKTAIRTEWDFFYFAASIEEHMPLKLQAAVETALSDDEISEDGVATDSTSSSSSSSTGSAAAETQMVSKESRTGGSQDPTQHQFAMTRKTIHVVSSWNQPASGTAAMRMACGRQLLTSSLKMISYGDVADSTSTLCNHPGCRQIWSNFEA